MFEQYKGLTFYNGSIRAVFALSSAVKNGFDFHHRDVTAIPEDVAVDTSLLQQALQTDKFFIIPSLGIVLDEHALRQIASVTKDRSLCLGGAQTLPPTVWAKTITYHLAMDA